MMMMDPTPIRRVVRYFKTAGVMNGKPKTARDYKAGVDVEMIKAQVQRECTGGKAACIWGGFIEEGTYFARVYEGERRRMNKSMVPITREYHFSCLPQRAMYLRRFFEPLPWRSTMCLSGTGPLSHRNFSSPEEWHAWMGKHYPSMSKKWQSAGNGWWQHGTDYHWCRLDRRG